MRRRRCDSFAGRLTVLCMSNMGLQALGFLYRIFLTYVRKLEDLRLIVVHVSVEGACEA